ncbi:hypothetical protein XELAEV_18027560mg [Xenopus laevis]|uniref:Uncharacterized protein n=1 Tax=Xenopus laevis TaxID=8355 RepID=A0A974HKE2_XENLA|nr:hypothetical protein XELAEV_18027560mg [Xenopus laevis]
MLEEAFFFFYIYIFLLFFPQNGETRRIKHHYVRKAIKGWKDVEVSSEVDIVPDGALYGKTLAEARRDLGVIWTYNTVLPFTVDFIQVATDQKSSPTSGRYVANMRGTLITGASLLCTRVARLVVFQPNWATNLNIYKRIERRHSG